METFDQWYDRQPLVLLDRKTEHRLTWEACASLYVEEIKRLQARITELIEKNDALQDALTDATDRAESYAVSSIGEYNSVVDKLAAVVAALQAANKLIDLVVPFEGDVTRQINKALSAAMEAE